MPGGVIRFGFVTLLFGVIFLSFSPSRAMADSNKVLARVNGVEIRQWQIGLTESILFGSLDNHKHLSQVLRDEILKNAIDTEVVYQDALKRGVTPDEQSVSRFQWNYKASFPSLTEYRDRMQSMGATEADLATLARKLVVMIDCLNKEYGDAMAPTEDDAKKYYEDHPEDFTLPQAVRIRHILVAIAPEKGVTRKIAKARAKEILARVKSGKEPFSLVARETSDGPEKVLGGDLGYISKGSLENTELAPLEDTVLKLQPGEVGKLVETSIGFHIVKALDIRPESVTPFEKIKEKLILTLKKRRLVENLNDLASKLRPGFKIENLATP